MTKKFEIRNSTAEFLAFVAENKEDGVQVFYKDATIWATQQAIATLFDKNKSTISRHIANIYSEGELQPETTVAKFATVVNRGIRGEVEDDLDYYNLDMIISVGYRTNSRRATQFRQWATYILRQYAIRGYVIDRKRMENGSFIGEDYFEHLLAENTRNRNWGKGMLAQISERLRSELPGLRGFGERHLKNMRTFYEEWSMLEPNSAIAIAEIPDTSDNDADTIRQLRLTNLPDFPWQSS